MVDFFQIDDVGVVAELLKDSDFTDSCARDSIVAVIYLNLFNCYNCVVRLNSHGSLVNGLVHNTISTLAEF